MTSDAPVAQRAGEASFPPQAVRTSDLEEVLDVLEDVVNQACLAGDNLVDSMALTAYADAMRLLARHGRLDVEDEDGRRVIGRWTAGR